MAELIQVCKATAKNANKGTVTGKIPSGQNQHYTMSFSVQSASIDGFQKYDLQVSLFGLFRLLMLYNSHHGGIFFMENEYE